MHEKRNAGWYLGINQSTNLGFIGPVDEQARIDISYISSNPGLLWQLLKRRLCKHLRREKKS
jgi:hypothetical protein